MTPFTFQRHNGTPRAVVILMCVYAGLIALVILFDQLKQLLKAAYLLFRISRLCLLFNLLKEISGLVHAGCLYRALFAPVL